MKAVYLIEFLKVSKRVPICRLRSCAASTTLRTRATTCDGESTAAWRSPMRMRLKALEAENVRLKKLLVESMLESEVTRRALQKAMVSASTQGSCCRPWWTRNCRPVDAG